MKLLGFGELQGADPRTTFLSAGARLIYAGDEYPADIFLTVRRGIVAAAFHATDTDGCWRLMNSTAPQFEVRPITSIGNAGTIVEDLELRPAGYDGPTCWRSGHDPKTFDDRRRSWWASVFMKTSSRPLPLAKTGRTHGKGEPLRLAIVGEIGEQRYNSGEILAQLRDASDRDLLLAIDSPGGSTIEGLAIYRGIAAHPRHVTTEIVGPTASVGTIIAEAADTRLIARDATLMIHSCHISTPVEAGADVLRKVAAEMDRTNEQMATIVAHATGCGLTRARAWIRDGKTFTAGEAIEQGLVHGIMDDLVPALPSAPRARFRAIRGAYASVRPKAAPPPLYAMNGRYRAGQQVRHGGKVYTCTKATFGAPGLQPDRDARCWQVANA